MIDALDAENALHEASVDDLESSDDDELPQGWIYIPALKQWRYEPTGYKTSLLSEVHSFNKGQKILNPYAHISEEQKDELEKEVVPIDIRDPIYKVTYVRFQPLINLRCSPYQI